MSADQATTGLPRGFVAHVANVGIKDGSLDLSVVATTGPSTSAAVFTKSRFAGASVLLSRDHAAGGRARGIVTISKNANVATGAHGEADAREVLDAVARVLDLDARELLIGSTGVIGHRYPMGKVRAHLASLTAGAFTASLGDVAAAIMTTDTHPKVARTTVGGGAAGVGSATVVGVAKGAGMIEPDMATLLAYVLTDAEVAPAALDRLFRVAVDDTFNCLSIDTDTSTSDTAVLLASGAAGPVDADDLAAAVRAVCLDLTMQLARDGEGATKLLEVHVDGGRDPQQAKRVARSIVSSPLVKTAVHGADPNWGRVAMAVGKCTGDTDITPESTVIRFGDLELYPSPVGEADLAALAALLAADHVRIHVSVGAGGGTATAWGCDLSAGYVSINADYTT